MTWKPSFSSKVLQSWQKTVSLSSRGDSGWHVLLPSLTIWKGSLKQTLPFPDSAGKQTIPQQTHKGFFCCCCRFFLFFFKPFCFQIQLYKGLGVEVLCWTSPMKRCHCNSSSDNSLGVTNLLAYTSTSSDKQLLNCAVILTADYDLTHGWAKSPLGAIWLTTPWTLEHQTEHCKEKRLIVENECNCISWLLNDEEQKEEDQADGHHQMTFMSPQQTKGINVFVFFKMAKNYRYVLRHPVEHLENRAIYWNDLFFRDKYRESVNTVKNSGLRIRSLNNMVIYGMPWTMWKRTLKSHNIWQI